MLQQCHANTDISRKRTYRFVLPTYHTDAVLKTQITLNFTPNDEEYLNINHFAQERNTYKHEGRKFSHILDHLHFYLYVTYFRDTGVELEIPPPPRSTISPLHYDWGSEHMGD